MRNTQAECVLPLTLSGLGGSFFTLQCPVPTTFSNLLTLVSSLPILKLQNLINTLLSPNMQAKYSLVVQDFLEANAQGATGVLAKFQISIVGSGTPTATDIDLLCTAYTTAVQVSMPTTVTQCAMSLISSSKKRSIGQTTETESDFVTELTLAPPQPLGGSSASSGWLYPVIGGVGGLIVLIVVIVVIVCCCCRNKGGVEPEYAYRKL